MVEFDPARYEEDGFYVLRGVLPERELAELRAHFVELFAHLDTIPSRVREMDRDQAGPVRQPEVYRPLEIDKALAKTDAYRTLRRLCREIFDRNMAYVFDHAICKMPHTDTITPMHQDQAYMSGGVELKTVNLWIPMQAADAHNGTMEYIPGSHRSGLRTHEASGSAAAHLLEMDGQDTPLVRVDLAPGDVAIHHPLTAHRAGPNRSGEPRYAWALHFGPHGRLAYLHPRHVVSALAGRARRKLAARRPAQAPAE